MKKQHNTENFIFENFPVLGKFKAYYSKKPPLGLVSAVRIYNGIVKKVSEKENSQFEAIEVKFSTLIETDWFHSQLCITMYPN